MEMKDISKNIKLAMFKGKRDEWGMRSTKFVAFATFRDFDNILLGRSELTSENESNSDEVRRYKKLNNFGYYYLNYTVEEFVSV